MNLSFLYDRSVIKLPEPNEKKSSWLKWFGFRRRKPNSDEEINEIHDLILNVHESMDDQARAVLLSLSKIIHDEDQSITIEEKIKALVAIGHSLCCAHMQVKNSTQVYSNILVRALSHEDFRMRLVAIIAIAETAIDNLSFQTKLNEIGIIPKLFEIMKTAMPNAGCTFDDINEHSKLVAWCCYSIVNISVNCMPNILLLKDIIPTELKTLQDAVRMEIWCHVWRENYAQTLLQFADRELVADIIRTAVQPKPYSFEDHVESTSNASSSSNDTSLSTDNQRCIIS